MYQLNITVNMHHEAHREHEEKIPETQSMYQVILRQWHLKNIPSCTSCSSWWKSF